MVVESGAYPRLVNLEGGLVNFRPLSCVLNLFYTQPSPSGYPPFLTNSIVYYTFYSLYSLENVNMYDRIFQIKFFSFHFFFFHRCLFFLRMIYFFLCIIYSRF